LSSHFLPPRASPPRPNRRPAPTPTRTYAQPPDILYTNDEHGWLAAQKNKDGSSVGGAAEMLGRWREQEGYTPDGPFLMLSGGDMWTGPAISSFQRIAAR
jgi:2',3'-cyclic-nucleotide 2'-phosphodiesterase (5'-nucleotidase family)